MNITASAPGKLVLLGEYAVLEGAPAISVAIGRRAVARLKPRLGSRCDAYAPDILDTRVPFTIGSDGLPAWADAASAGKLSLIDQVLRGLADEHVAPGPGAGFGLELDTHQFFYSLGGETLKLGLGSSAALTVALATALVAHAGRGAVAANRRVWLQRLLALHRKFQGGHGSGVDVATSLIGGVIAYQLIDGDHQRPVARELVWPDEIKRLYVWSGRSASTSAALSKLGAWRADHAAEYRTRMNDLIAVATSAVTAVEHADGGAFIDAATVYAEGLRGLGDASGLDIFSAEHNRIAEMARAAGTLYKPCGAGVGDVGVVFALDDERLEVLRRQLADAGFASVPLTIDETGLKLEFTEIDEA